MCQLDKRNRADELVRAAGGRKVVVVGVAVRYDDLGMGPRPPTIAAKKYYEDVVVENFCLRDFVFVP